MEPHEIDLIAIERMEQEANDRFDAFRPHAVEAIQVCLEKCGCLCDVINDLDLEYDEYDSLTDSEVNEMVIEAIKNITTIESGDISFGGVSLSEITIVEGE